MSKKVEGGDGTGVGGGGGGSGLVWHNTVIAGERSCDVYKIGIQPHTHASRLREDTQKIPTLTNQSVARICRAQDLASRCSLSDSQHRRDVTSLALQRVHTRSTH